MKKFNKEIERSSMSWYEKIDLKLSHYSLPIVPVLSFLLAICTISLGFLGYPVIHYSLGIYIIMIIFLCSPMIPDLFVYHKSKNFLLLIPYFLTNIITYASLEPMMLKTIILGIFGKKAVFTVTPKETNHFTFSDSIKYTIDSIIFGLIMAILSCFACGSILPVIFVSLCCLLSPAVILLSNISTTKQTQNNTKTSKQSNMTLLTSSATTVELSKAAIRRELSQDNKKKHKK